jgi:TonB family protein
MLLDQNPELQLRATTPKTLVVSILIHFLLIAILAFNPGWFETTHRRVVRIAGEDFDLSKLELRQLTLPPRMPPRAMPAPTPPPPVQQPQVQQPPQVATPPPPPPPPPPPTPPPPDRVIRPDDILAEGARPDGSPRVSRGNTQEQARAGNQAQKEGPSSEAQEAKEAQRGQSGREAQQLASNAPNKVLPNLNRDALQVPSSSLRSDAGKIVEANLASAARTGGRTGLARADNNGSYSTTEPQILSPNPKGIDFGPYLNRLLDTLRSNWYSVMPEIARLGKQGRVDIVFTVGKNGNVKDLQVVANSGTDALDRGAVSAIQLSNPFQHLPSEYETDLKLRIAFLYNMNP